MVTSGLVYYSSVSSEILETHNVKIEKDKDDNWRVRDNSGNNKGTMRVKGTDKINWHAKGSDMVFIFSKDVADYFDFEEGIFEDGRTQKIDRSKMLRVELKKNAPEGTLEYEVYVVDAGRSVVGNSPPKIIIMK